MLDPTKTKTWTQQRPPQKKNIPGNLEIMCEFLVSQILQVKRILLTGRCGVDWTQGTVTNVLGTPGKTATNVDPKGRTFNRKWIIWTNHGFSRGHSLVFIKKFMCLYRDNCNHRLVGGFFSPTHPGETNARNLDHFFRDEKKQIFETT